MSTVCVISIIIDTPAIAYAKQIDLTSAALLCQHVIVNKQM